MMRLYRGVSRRMDTMLNGELTPKGNKSEIMALHDGKIRNDETFTHGKTESNAVRAQHIESGLYDNCFISTTMDEKKAILFATTEYTEPGYIYTLDASIFSLYKVVSKKFPDPLYPDEMEISIREENCGAIPKAVIINKYEVDKNGKKKT